MKYLAHHTGAWDYNPVARSVIAQLSSGALIIPICTERSPRDGAFFVSRRGEDVWRIAPVLCVLTNDGWIGRSTAFDDAGIHCEFIYLIGMPSKLEQVMSELYAR